jgi:hypothetical protein
MQRPAQAGVVQRGLVGRVVLELGVHAPDGSPIGESCLPPRARGGTKFGPAPGRRRV